MGLKEKILGRNNSVDVSEDVEGSGDYAEVGGQEKKSGLVQRIKKMGASGAKKVREKAEDPRTRQAAVEALRQIAESQGESRKGEPNDITGGRGGSTEEIMGRVTRTAEASPPVDATLQPTSRLGNVSDLARGRGMDEGSRSGDGMGGLGGMGTLKIGESLGDGMTPDEMATNYRNIGRGMMRDGEEREEARSLLYTQETPGDRSDKRRDLALVDTETEMVAESFGEYDIEGYDWSDLGYGGDRQ